MLIKCKSLRPLLVAISTGLLLTVTPSSAQTQTLSLPPDCGRWDLQGHAKAADYQGRKCLFLHGGAAVLKDFEMRDGVTDVDVATPANFGFFGFQWRIANDGANSEEVYLRQHKSSLPDAMQYTPGLNTGRNWQIYNGPGFTGAVNIPKGVWFHLRLEVTGIVSFSELQSGQYWRTPGWAGKSFGLMLFGAAKGGRADG